MTLEERAQGCLIGSAYGDSLGAAIEFESLAQIRKRHGEQGVGKLLRAYGRVGNITGDTQMALATADGLLAVPRRHRYDAEEITRAIWHSYGEWFKTQFLPGQNRAPGTTCMAALRSGVMGTLAEPLNTSAGCGAIMRAHPIGIAYFDRPDFAAELGVASGAITHGHPNGYLPAGFLAHMVAGLVQGEALADTIQGASDWLRQRHSGDAGGVEEAVRQALAAPRLGSAGDIIDSQVGQRTDGSGGAGGGWQGHDALAIGLYAVLRAHDDPIEAVRVAVNHSGDSDSTGAIAGAIMGTIHGSTPFEVELQRQKVRLEHHERLGELAVRLINLTAS